VSRPPEDRRMRLPCYGCGKSVSSEVPEDTVVRAALFCPECIEIMVDKGLLRGLPYLHDLINKK